VGKRGATLLRDELAPVALFLPEGCPVLFREVVDSKISKSKQKLVQSKEPKPEIRLTAKRDKGARAFLFDSESSSKGVRFVQVVGAVSETGFVRDLIVPLPKASMDPRGKLLFRLPSSGSGRGDWNGLLRIEGGQAYPVHPKLKAGFFHVPPPEVRCLLTIFRPGKERSFGGRIVLEQKDKSASFLFPYSADSHGKVLLKLPRAKFRILAYEPGVGIHEERLDLTEALPEVKKELILKAFFEFLVRVQIANGKPVKGALCRWRGNRTPNPLFGGNLSPLSLRFRVLGLRKGGRLKTDANGVARVFLYPDVNQVRVWVRAKLGKKTLTFGGSKDLLADDGTHIFKVVLK
jgi:hypothetical protein